MPAHRNEVRLSEKPDFSLADFIASVVRRLLFARIADLRRLSQRHHAPLQPRDLLTVSAQLPMQAQQRFVHLFEIMLSMSQRRFEADQSLVGRCRGRRGFSHRGGESV